MRRSVTSTSAGLIDRTLLASPWVPSWLLSRRRGRAATVCALSPPGLWSSGDGLQARAFKSLRKNQTLGRLLRPAFPLMYRSAALRRLAFRDAAVHGDRLTPAQALEIADDTLAAQCSMTFRRTTGISRR